MNILNVVKLKFGLVEDIYSFTADNKKEAESCFLNIARELGYGEDIDEILLENGYYEVKFDPEMECVCINWSNI